MVTAIPLVSGPQGEEAGEDSASPLTSVLRESFMPTWRDSQSRGSRKASRTHHWLTGMFISVLPQLYLISKLSKVDFLQFPF